MPIHIQSRCKKIKNSNLCKQKESYPDSKQLDFLKEQLLKLREAHEDYNVSLKKEYEEKINFLTFKIKHYENQLKIKDEIINKQENKLTDVNKDVDNITSKLSELEKPPQSKKPKKVLNFPKTILPDKNKKKMWRP